MLDDHEYSRLMYLIAAVRHSPHRVVKLLEISSKNGGSDEYMACINRLRNAEEQLIEECAALCPNSSV